MDEQEIWDCWVNLDRMVRFKHRLSAKKHGLTLEQFHLLIELDELELDLLSEDALSPTIGEIAADLGNAPHTLSGKIKRLEKKGLVKKVRDEHDQRINRVIFTDEGRDLMAKIKKEVSDTFISNALKMDETDLKNLIKGLNELNNGLSQ